MRVISQPLQSGGLAHSGAIWATGEPLEDLAKTAFSQLDAVLDRFGQAAWRSLEQLPRQGPHGNILAGNRIPS